MQMDADFWNHPAIWTVVASSTAAYAERQRPQVMPCKVRITQRNRDHEVLGFVGRVSDGACRPLVSELAAKGYVVLGHGMSESGLNWGIVVALPEDNGAVNCGALESLELELAGQSCGASEDSPPAE
jgi:hypothetical protein